MNGLMLMVWLGAFAGYLWFGIEKGKLHPAVVPLAAMGTITAVLYAGAIAHVLLPTLIAVVAVGIVLLGRMLYKRSKALLHWELLVFALGCAALAVRYHGALLVQYDDYSHWGMIVRHLLLTDRLPQHGDELITFQSYPPGAAIWIYFVCRLLGRSEGIMLAAQAAMTLAGWFSLLALAGGKGRILKRIACGGMMVVGLSLFQGTASLMVDNLLAAVAVGSLCFCVQENVGEDTIRPWILGMLLAVLALIKDGGLFFVAVLVVAYGALSFGKSTAKRWWGGMATICAPVLVLRTSWSVHTKLAFPAAGITRHAFTFENMRAMGADKSYENIFEIGLKVLREAGSLHNLAVQALCGILLLAIVLRLIRQAEKHDGLIVLAAVAVYGAWLISLWLMYTFSMTLENANSLVAFERYNSTCALFLLGMLAVWALKRDVVSDRDAALMAVCMCLPLVTGAWNNGVERLLHETYHVPLRSNMEKLAQERPLKSDEHAAVVIDPQENGMYAGYMARYTFQRADIQVLFPETVDENDSLKVYYWLCSDPSVPNVQGEIVQTHP